MEPEKSRNIAESYIVEGVENKKRISGAINEEISRFAKKPRIETISSSSIVPETGDGAMEVIEKDPDEMPILTQNAQQACLILHQNETSVVDRVITTKTKSIILEPVTGSEEHGPLAIHDQSKNHAQDVSI